MPQGGNDRPARGHQPSQPRADVDEEFARQLAAVIAAGSRREALRSVSAPTLVIHGDADPLVPVEGGVDTANAVPEAKLVIMSHNQVNMYDIEPHIAEIYDRVETYQDDVELIRRLIEKRRFLRILEPFCGPCRILIPLARSGHELVGLDQARGMLDRARQKIRGLPENVQHRITLIEADVTSTDWPQCFDLVILGGNCFYELATPQEQEGCIISAAASLRPGGYLYVDNNHMEGDLDPSWQKRGVSQGFPAGTCSDGTRVETSTETIWHDAPRRLVRFRRRTTVTLPDGSTIEEEYVQQKHPVSTVEVHSWLEAHGFFVERLHGDRAGNRYTERSKRVIFWARKYGKETLV